MCVRVCGSGDIVQPAEKGGERGVSTCVSVLGGNTFSLKCERGKGGEHVCVCVSVLNYSISR
jgi:hypothetical protein